jgi:hypothetical protein
LQRLPTLVREPTVSPPARGVSRDTQGAAAGAIMTPHDNRGAAAGANKTPRDTQGAAVGGSTPRAEVKTLMMAALHSNSRGPSTSTSSRPTGTATPNQPRESEKQRRVGTPFVTQSKRHCYG